MGFMDAGSSVTTAQPSPHAAACAWAQTRWAGETRAAFARRADRFTASPQHEDLDLVIFGKVDGFRPERHMAPDGTPVDLAWYPAAWLDDAERIASSGLAAHRLALSDPAWAARTDDVDAAHRVRALMPRPDLLSARLAIFLDMGRLTVRETGITHDLPSLARFWLQMGHAGVIAALAELHGLYCPNVYTRPFDVLAKLGDGLTAQVVDALGLDDDPHAVAEAVLAMHALVSPAFDDPPWPAGMREATRAEYRYTLDAAELRWRLAVAKELADGGQGPAAVWMLRYWAYALSRLPMVFAAAARGEDLAFLRPERAVRPALAAHCPALLPWLARAMGGPTPPSELSVALASLQALRLTVNARIRARRLPIALDDTDWQPFRVAA
jgi:hypothetical protein